MEPLVTAAEMREFDRHTIETIGVPALSLMESAGRAVAVVVEQLCRTEPRDCGAVVVVAGPGHNGGDGLVAARALHANGRAVRVLVVGDETALRGDVRVCLDAARRQGVAIELAATVTSLDRVLDAGAAVIIDALYGTGLAREVAGEPAAIIRAMNASAIPIVAVDLPSGLDADRGVALGVVVRAHTTVTFGFLKRGLYASPGFAYAGRVICADIGIARRLADEVPARLLDRGVLAPFLRRDPLGHKGTHGHVFLIAGSVGKIGAALLAGRACLRAGAGLCTVASPVAAQARIEGRLPELMSFGYPGVDTDSGAHLGLDVSRAASALTSELNGKRVIAIGPGVPTAPAFAEVIERVVYAAIAEGLTVVLDADGLNHLAHRPSLLAGRPGAGAVVLTPHPGEAARLLNTNVAAIEADRFGAAAALAQRFSAVVVLKGARTVITAPDGRVAVCAAGGPILGVGGTGDVLTGAIAALLAVRAADAFQSACAGVFLHATAADRLAATGIDRGLSASELADALPATFHAG